MERVATKIQQINSDVRSGDYFLSAKVAYIVRELSMGSYVHFLNVFLSDVGLNTSEVGVK